MKSFLFILFFATAAIFPSFAQTNNGIPLPGRTTIESANSSASGLANLAQIYSFYNPDSTLQHEVEKSWDATSNTWVNSYQYFYSNNPDGRLAENLRLGILPDSTWLKFSRVLFSYYPDPTYLEGGAKVRQTQYWDDVSQQWKTLSVQTITAFGPANGDLEGETANSSVESFSQGVKTYGNATNYTKVAIPNGVLLTSTTQTAYNATLGIDEFASRQDYIYNNPASLEYDTILNYPWSSFNMDWATIANYRTTQTLLANERITLQQEYLGGNQWVDVSRVTSITDNADRLVSYKSEQWDAIADSFKEYFRLELTYNPDHSVETVLNYGRDFSGPDQVLYLVQKISYEYGTSFVGTQIPTLQAKVNVFPNPAANFVQIILDNTDGKDAKYTLFDSKGIVVTQLTKSGNNAFVSLIGQPAGIYFLHIEQGGAVKVIPVLKN